MSEPLLLTLAHSPDPDDAFMWWPLVGIDGAAPEIDTGRWRFKLDDRPVKAVIVGGSVSAWPRGGYGQFLQAACSRVEPDRRGRLLESLRLDIQ